MHSLILLCVLATDWWTNYGDPELNRIVDKALANNIDLQIATQRIAEARAMTGQAKSKLGPTIDATGSAQQIRGGFAQGIVRVSQGGSGSFVSPFETGLIQSGLDMKWEIDFFGSNRAGLSAARADVVAEEQHRQDLAITISAEAARCYIELRGTEDRIAITKRNIAAQRDLLALTEDRAKAGLASQLDSERQRVLLVNTEATLPGLEAERTLHLNRLAVLVGDESFAKSALSAQSRQLQAPSIKSELPSELLKRRPDVRAAEARLAAAMARLKQARTDLYPKISLNGLAGRQGTSLTSLSLGGGNFFGVGPQLQLPIFNSGRIRSNIAVNDSKVEQEKLAYRQEILLAFEEAANAIASLQSQQEREAKLAAASDSAQSSLRMSTDLQQAGLNDFLTVLDAERSVFDADYQRSAARTQVLVQSIALYKALAGGWPK